MEIRVIRRPKKSQIPYSRVYISRISQVLNNEYSLSNSESPENLAIFNSQIQALIKAKPTLEEILKQYLLVTNEIGVSAGLSCDELKRELGAEYCLKFISYYVECKEEESEFELVKDSEYGLIMFLRNIKFQDELMKEWARASKELDLQMQTITKK